MAIDLKALDALHLSPSRPALAPGAMAASEGQAPRYAVDRWHASVEGGAKALGQKAEALAGGGPLGQLVQFGVGAASGLLAIPNGLYQVLRHPVATFQGLWAMASQLPLVSPMWLLRAAQVGPAQALGESAQFWGQVGQAWIEPFRAEWQAGRYAALAGRLSVEVGLLLVGARQAKAALDSRQALRAGQGALAAQATALGAEASQGAKAVQALQEGVQATRAAKGAGRLAKPGAKAAQAALPEPQLLKALPKLDEAAGSAKAVGRVRKAQQAQASGGLSRAEAFRKLRQGPKLKPARLPEQVGALAQQRHVFRRLRMVGPDRLKADASIRRSYRSFVKHLDRRMDGELEALLGHRPQGLPKRPERAADKLRLWRQQEPNLRLGAVDDLARGRLDLERFDLSEIRAMQRRLSEHYGPERLKVVDHLEGNAMYRGRLHLKIKDATGAWYELQIGPKQLSQFYETPMTVAGLQSNLHDLVYKGVLRLEPEAIRHLGGGNLAAGQARIDRVVASYQQALSRTLEAASAGKALPAQVAAGLHGQLEGLFSSLPQGLLPSVLRP